MKKQKKLMNQYVADLAVLNVKFHNLHWNVTGEIFKSVHEYLEELYDELFEYYDEVAERLKMLGEFPLASMRSYLEATNVEELTDRDYPYEEAYKIVKDDIESLRERVTEIRNLADDNGDFGTVAMLEDQIAEFDKQIWFLEQTVK